MTLACLVTGSVAAYAIAPVAFIEEQVSLTRTGAGIPGRLFERVDNPSIILLVTENTTFLINRSFKTVYIAEIHTISGATDPIMIDYGTLSKIQGAGLIVGSDGDFSFLAGGDRYAVAPRDPGSAQPR